MEQDVYVDFLEFNKNVREWAAATQAQMEAGIPVDSGKTQRSVTRRIRKSGASISGISFPFQRSGIFVEYGAGKGYGGRVGSSWYDNKGNRRTTNPNSLGLMNSGLRKATPWIEPALDDKIPDLEKIVTGFYASASARVNQFKIDFKK